jgi:hypothetical protein
MSNPDMRKPPTGLEAQTHEGNFKNYLGRDIAV